MPNFDDLRAVVVAGNGIVARFPGVLCLARSDDPATLRALLEIVRGAAGPAPGHVLARRLAAWLVGADAPTESCQFGTVAAAGENVAVFLAGGVSALVPDAGLTVSSAESAAWADRLFPRPDTPVVLTIDGVAIPPNPGADVSDLRTGVVPGAAVVLLETGACRIGPKDWAAASAVESDAGPTDATEDHESCQSEPVPAANSGEALQALPTDDPEPSPILGNVPKEPPRPPLGAGAPAAVPGRPTRTDESEPDQPQARGYLCSRGHLNDPRSHFCVQCGIRMNLRTNLLVTGPRPPLGLLVLDDGVTYTVDAEYLVGRMPDLDERVRSGGLRPIVVEDHAGALSRVHAEIRLSDWDVLLVDSGSRNGTYLVAPGEHDWVPLWPRESRRLLPGARVRIGARTFTFETPSGVR